MSIASLPSKSRSVESVTALEVALARVISDCRKEWSLHLQALQAETRAALLELNAVKKEFALVLNELNARVAVAVGPAGPAGEQGPPGPAGPAGPAGEKGDRGDKGETGDLGPHGFDGAAGVDGAPGRDGQPGRDGLNGVQGPIGDRGKDGRDGVNGKDGNDGLGVADFDVVHTGEREFVLRWLNGDRLIEKKFYLPIPIHRGVWAQGQYERNDVVTWMGSTFIATNNTKQCPSEKSDDWMLSVKRGHHGKDGKDGERGPQGPQGSPGRDLTQLSADGSKY